MFFHGSMNQLAIGLFLCPQSDGYVQTTESQDLEELMESCRPDELVSRQDAVYFTSDIELIEPLGGYSDYIYEVEPIGKYSKHDLAWYSEADRCLMNDDKLGAMAAAKSYWSGEPYFDLSNSAYEYLCSEAEVLDDV